MATNTVTDAERAAARRPLNIITLVMLLIGAGLAFIGLKFGPGPHAPHSIVPFALGIAVNIGFIAANIHNRRVINATKSRTYTDYQIDRLNHRIGDNNVWTGILAIFAAFGLIVIVYQVLA